MRRLAVAMLGLMMLFATAGCGSAPAEPIDSQAVVIDVRTPSEFAEGHLEGAVNIDLQSESFASQIAELQVEGSYVVYCRSGNRSAQATQLMREAGFEQVVDAGGVQAAADRTGLSVVTGG
ncbi:MAG: rhodanese-like domain-containing protein [Actinobacteria bacterium]|nr:rhodanese-like domain-containing protein [Actinomycetota bacterium]